MADAIQRVTTGTGDPAWLVTGYRTVRSLLTDDRLGRTHPRPESASRFSRSAAFDQPRAASDTERADHRRLRRTFTRSLSASRMRALQPRVTQLVEDRLAALERAERPADFHGVVSQPLPAMVICELLGVPDRHREQLVAWSGQAASRDGGERAREAYVRLCRYMAVLAARRGGPDDAADLLSALVREHTERAAGLAAELFLAGHLTTSTAIDKALVLLLSRPDRLAGLPPEEHLGTLVEELMRLPFPGGGRDTARLLPRYANTGLTIAGQPVDGGELVLLAVDEANLDPREFSCPADLDPARSPNPHLGFGHGPFSCVGAPLARLELRVLLGLLATRFPGLALAVPVGRLRPRTDLISGGLWELPVTW
ncbi:cytochrome P450 [Streptomyces sp. DSM 44915]|uniref:Cytochrome P450 n=1 Tax=Streptomyces chisholmiae TaxID=3075540 RepID=A0ABU2JP42_9ACTN|nr:cytochrome P450 [Streptomyces sp. DSM 44915]MDT0266503.1 cytochrome P450 [Streptomyces sp. DSM 44915]